MRPIDPSTAVRGQYVGGVVDGQAVPGYRQEPGVPANSEVETYFACKVEIDSWRWAGVPFYLRAGKRLAARQTEIAIVFRPAPLTLFEGCSIDAYRPNLLFIRIQPEEGIVFRFMAKQPGAEMCLQQVNMNFSYHDAFSTRAAEAYERLLHDALQGDQTLFLRSDSVQRAWEVVQPVLDAPSPIAFYAAGSWGPREGERLLAPLHWALQRPVAAP
jgi:glucose-6-phosphate 1-dehydrogenase